MFQIEDQTIVGLFWDRSEQAIAETDAKYGRYCYSSAYHILASAEDADESVNDTWLEAWNSMPPHRPAVLGTFLGKITRRLAIDKWRRRSAEKRGSGQVPLALEELEECIPAAQTVEQALEAAELARLLDQFLETLPDTQRRLFVCRYWYLDPIAALSRQFGFSQSKVKSMLHRTRKRLLEFLTEKGALDETE